jgi:hypothetical protein
MNPWRAAIKRSTISGSVASILSTAVIAALSARQTGSPFSGTNAESHGLWGEKAKDQRGLSKRYTATGFAIHHASSIFWASFFERSLDGQRLPAEVMKNAALTAAGAAAFDYLLMPRRLQPGFEANFSPRSMVSTFISIAAGLAAGRLLFDALTSPSSPAQIETEVADKPAARVLPGQNVVPAAKLDGAVL